MLDASYKYLYLKSKLQMLITEQERIIYQLVLIDTIIDWLLPVRQQKAKQILNEDNEISPLLQQIYECHQDTQQDWSLAFALDGTM